MVRQETLTLSFRWFESSLGNHAPVVELADTRDLKSLGVKPVPVRVWLGAPLVESGLSRHIDSVAELTNQLAVGIMASAKAKES